MNSFSRPLMLNSFTATLKIQKLFFAMQTCTHYNVSIGHNACPLTMYMYHFGTKYNSHKLIADEYIKKTIYIHQSNPIRIQTETTYPIIGRN